MEKRFICEICYKPFKTANGLKSHKYDTLGFCDEKKPRKKSKLFVELGEALNPMSWRT